MKKRLRIIGGKYKGARLFSPQTDCIRPTRDKIREMAFNILRHNVWSPEWTESYAVDACCGSGAYGLEALSRGAAACVFIDKSSRALSAARENVCRLERGEERARFLKSDIRRLPYADCPYHMIFLDPPYLSIGIGSILATLERKGWLAHGAILVIETVAAEKEIFFPRFTLLKYRQDRQTALIFLKYHPQERNTI